MSMQFAQALIARVLRSRLLETILVGCAAVVAQTLVFETIAIVFTLVSPSTAILFAAEVGIVTNFYLNNRFSFGDRAEGPLLYRFGRFHLVVLGSVLIQWLCMFGAEQVHPGLLVIHAVYAAGIVLGFIWNYNWYRLWVWKQVQ